MSDLAIRRGDDVTLQLFVFTRDVNSGGVTAVNLTGSTLWFTAKVAIADADTAAKIRKSTDGSIGGITITDAVNGLAEVSIANADTQSFSDTLAPLFYDAQYKSAAGKITTVDNGTLTVNADVTKAT